MCVVFVHFTLSSAFLEMLRGFCRLAVTHAFAWLTIERHLFSLVTRSIITQRFNDMSAVANDLVAK